MNERLHLPLPQAAREVLRESVAWVLAIVMIVPALIIQAVDKITSFWLKRRGGLN
jgi:hypothetical protein